MNILMPCLSTELVCNSLLLISVWRRWKILITPWLLFNSMIVLGLGSGVSYLLISFIEVSEDVKETRNLLYLIILLLFLTFAIVHCNLVIQLFASKDKLKPEEDCGTLVTVLSEDSSSEHLIENCSSQRKSDFLDSSFDSQNCEDFP